MSIARMPFSIIPVIDLLNGQAVHAVGGRRACYQPLQSIVHASSEPVPLARALRDVLGFQTLYLADLDAIAGRPPRVDIYREIIDSGMHLWVDAGLCHAGSLAAFSRLDHSSCTIIAGLETVLGPRELAAIVSEAGADRVIFSLDLFEGRQRTAAPDAWKTEDPVLLAGMAIECGIGRLLILDLARVGTGRGLGTSDLMRQIREAHPSVPLAVGGGISRIDELADLRAAGASAVLVGSAIHDGRIGARELGQLATGSLWC